MAPDHRHRHGQINILIPWAGGGGGGLSDNYRTSKSDIDSWVNLTHAIEDTGKGPKTKGPDGTI